MDGNFSAERNASSQTSRYFSCVHDVLHNSHLLPMRHIKCLIRAAQFVRTQQRVITAIAARETTLRGEFAGMAIFPSLEMMNPVPRISPVPVVPLMSMTA